MQNNTCNIWSHAAQHQNPHGGIQRRSKHNPAEITRAFTPRHTSVGSEQCHGRQWPALQPSWANPIDGPKTNSKFIQGPVGRPTEAGATQLGGGSWSASSTSSAESRLGLDSRAPTVSPGAMQDLLLSGPTGDDRLLMYNGAGTKSRATSPPTKAPVIQEKPLHGRGSDIGVSSSSSSTSSSSRSGNNNNTKSTSSDARRYSNGTSTERMFSTNRISSSTNVSTSSNSSSTGTFSSTRGKQPSMYAGSHERLTAWTLKAKDLHELKQLYEEGPVPPNASNVVAMLSQLSWVYSARGDAQQPAMQQRVMAFAAVLLDRLASEPQLSVGERIQSVSALGRLGFTDQERISAALPRLLEALPSFDKPSHFAEASWAIAKLGRDPGQAWIAELLDSSRTKVHLLNLVELGNMIWALAKWGYRPGSVWMTLFFRRCIHVLDQLDAPAQQPMAADDGPAAPAVAAAALRGGKALAAQQKAVQRASTNLVRSLTSVTWGLAMLRVQLPPQLANCIMAEAQVQFPNMDGRALSNTVWALCYLDVKPPRSWTDDFLAHAQRAMPRFSSGMSFSNIIWALANWRIGPGEPWMQEFVRAATPLLPRLNPEEMSTLLQGLADVEHSPPKPWVSACLEVFHKNLERGPSPGPATSPTTVTTLLWALSKLLQTCSEDQPSARVPSAGGRSFSGPGRSWLAFYRPLLLDLLDVAAAGMPQLKPAMLVDLLVALADLGFHPGDEWLELHEECCNAVVSEFTAYQVNLLYRAMDVMESLEAPPLRRTRAQAPPPTLPQARPLPQLLPVASTSAPATALVSRQGGEVGARQSSSSSASSSQSLGLSLSHRDQAAERKALIGMDPYLAWEADGWLQTPAWNLPLEELGDGGVSSAGHGTRRSTAGAGAGGVRQQQGDSEQRARPHDGRAASAGQQLSTERQPAGRGQYRHVGPLSGGQGQGYRTERSNQR